MNAQHTPGPWKVNHKSGYPTFSSGSIDDAHGRTIAAILPTQKRPVQERAANANLIAAAPELLDSEIANLAVLENLLVYLLKHEAKLPPVSLSSLEVRIEKTRAALAKAQG